MVILFPLSELLIFACLHITRKTSQLLRGDAVQPAKATFAVRERHRVTDMIHPLVPTKKVHITYGYDTIKNGV